jgi:hypothetical protein
LGLKQIRLGEGPKARASSAQGNALGLEARSYLAACWSGVWVPVIFSELSIAWKAGSLAANFSSGVVIRKITTSFSRGTATQC